MGDGIHTGRTGWHKGTLVLKIEESEFVTTTKTRDPRELGPS